MTVMTPFLALQPIMWSMGGIFTSFLLELLVYPGVYEIWKWNFVLKRGKAE